MKKIFLYGPPGSSKSSVGRVLAKNLALPFIDIDVEIENAAGQPIPQIMAERGESAFRDLESAALESACIGEAGIIALGGGAMLRSENRARAEATGQVVFLNPDLQTLLERLKLDADKRPLLSGDLEIKLKNLMEARRSLYDSFGLRVDNKEHSPEQLAWQIQQKLGLFHVRGMGAGYNVCVQPGGLDELGRMLKERNMGAPVAVVADSNVAPIYSERVLASLHAAGYESSLLVIPAGEDNKTLETVSSLWSGFLEAGLDRKSTVVALGGGVIGDLAGFAAATFMRGIPWVGVPTTLLSMVDSSLGGKTGFDLAEGKNLVGSFYSPRLVLADPEVLSTLAVEELRSGLGEVVKHGIISDPELFALCSKGFDFVKSHLDEIVRRAMAVKINVIEVDPYERGIRAALNLGHTVGHAVETVCR
jgi:shikimate kinase / 3-dehydroquinate synthase